MPQVDEKDIIWIQEAAQEPPEGYGINRKTLDKLMGEGKLSRVERGVDRKVYLLRSELDALVGFKVVAPRREAAAG
jgi:hypothetical protein